MLKSKKILTIIIVIMLCLYNINFTVFGTETSCDHINSIRDTSTIYRGNYSATGTKQHSYNKYYKVICYDCNNPYLYTLADTILYFESHSYATGNWTGNHYHPAGDVELHYFECTQICSLCGYEDSSNTVWISKYCAGDSNGNGCILPYNVPVEEVEY